MRPETRAPMIENNQRRYQVFVSSTYRDLQSERRSVVEAILEIEGFPAGMELFPAANDEQWAFIKRQIESSDYYIILIGGRYGSLARDGIGYTEKEYDYAVELGIPIMAFLRRDIDHLEPGQSETNKKLRKRLLAFRKKVSAGRLVKFFEHPDTLKGETWAALSNAFNHQPRPGWVRARIPPGIMPTLSVRRAVSDMLTALSSGSNIIRRLIYVVMAMEDESDGARFRSIIAECERLGFVAIHRREIEPLVENRLDTIHDLIGRANLVIFDLSRPDFDTAYQLGVQRGFGEIDEEGVLVITDDPMTPIISYAPFRIRPIADESDLRTQIRRILRRLLAQENKKRRKK